MTWTTFVNKNMINSTKIFFFSIFARKVCFGNHIDIPFPPRTSKVSNRFYFRKVNIFWFIIGLELFSLTKCFFMFPIQSVKIICLTCPGPCFNLPQSLTRQVETVHLLYISRCSEQIVSFMCCFYLMVYRVRIVLYINTKRSISAN